MPMFLNSVAESRIIHNEKRNGILKNGREYLPIMPSVAIVKNKVSNPAETIITYNSTDGAKYDAMPSPTSNALKPYNPADIFEQFNPIKYAAIFADAIHKSPPMPVSGSINVTINNKSASILLFEKKIFG